MIKPKLLASYKFAVAALVLAAVITQFTLSFSSNPNFNIVNFFSFFTIESNILAAIVFIATGIFQWRGKSTAQLTLWRGAATLYMSVTGLVYITLLSGLEESLNTPTPWVNFVLHYLFPAVAFLDWFIDRPAVHVTFKKSLLWLVFPVAYIVYSLIRGPFVNWYPYPFLDPTTNGYGEVTVVCLGIASVTIGICAAFAAVSGKGQTKKRAAYT
jgi:hypothetical protein